MLDPFFDHLRILLTDRAAIQFFGKPFRSLVRSAFDTFTSDDTLLTRLYVELQAYIDRTGPDFGDVRLMTMAKSLHPLHFWNEVSNFTPNLREVALRVFRLVPSATGGKEILAFLKFLSLIL
jgi:hypothetical protein